GQVARHLVAVLDRLDGGALEGDRRELLDVEEVGAAQVVVALLVGGVDALGLDGHAERALAGVPVDREVAGEVVEPAVDPTQPEVRDLEGDAGGGGVEGVLVRGPPRRGGAEREDEDRDQETLAHKPYSCSGNVPISTVCSSPSPPALRGRGLG